MIATHERQVAVVIPSGFSRSVERAAFRQKASEPAGQLDLIVDPALSAQLVGPIQGAVTGLGQQAAMLGVMPQGIDRFMDDIETNGGHLAQSKRQSLRAAALGAIGSETGSSVSESLVRVRRTHPAGIMIDRFPNVVQQNVPGWALFGVFFIAGTLANSVLEEKRLGTFRRILVAPVPRSVFLLGKLLPSLVINLIQIVLMFAVGVFVMPRFGAPGLELGPHPGALVRAEEVQGSTAESGRYRGQRDREWCFHDPRSPA